MSKIRFSVYKSLQLLVAALICATCFAQHPSEVQMLTAANQHFEALVANQKLPERRETIESAAAAARSAWALSLPEIARAEFDLALRLGGENKLDPVDRARILFSRGIIEFQEGKPELAALFSERAYNDLEIAGPLRSQVLSLWGESLFKMENYSAAEEKYTQAIEESEASDLSDLHFLLGRCLLKLGRFRESREHFEAISINDQRSPEAIRELARLALDDGDPEAVIFWLSKGRELYENNFVDSWVDYALVRAATQNGDKELVRKVRSNARQRFAPSDSWLVLLEATAENFEWNGNRSERVRSSQDTDTEVAKKSNELLVEPNPVDSADQVMGSYGSVEGGADQ